MRRIVIKIGSSLIALPEERKIDIFRLKEICRDIKKLIQDNYSFIIVSSGAIASAMVKHNLSQKPTKMATLQSLAAIGQIELMKSYQSIFSKYQLEIAQVLLTWDDFSQRRRYLNAKNTLEQLLKMNVIPIINENDAVAVEEIKFGDNDKLSALVACLINADLLIMLSDVEGIYNKDGQLIRDVFDIKEVAQFCKGTKRSFCTGGMATKIEAAEMATKFGIDVIIASGKGKNPIIKALENNNRTLIHAKKKLKAKKHWIAYGAKVKGKLIIDRGAEEAVVKGGKSILPSGVVDVEGHFEKGDLVAVCNQSLKEIARGIVNYSYQEVKLIRGKKSSDILSILGYKEDDEIIHRDELVLL